MKFKVDGRELSAEGMRVGEICEAEKALNLDMDQGSGAKIAIALFVAMRREDRKNENQKPLALLADDVMNVDMTMVEAEEEEEEGDERRPPDETVALNGIGDRESLRTSGPQPLGKSA